MAKLPTQEEREKALGDRVEALEDEIEKLRRLLNKRIPPVKRLDAIGKPFPVRGEPIIPTVED